MGWVQSYCHQILSPNNVTKWKHGSSSTCTFLPYPNWNLVPHNSLASANGCFHSLMLTICLHKGASFTSWHVIVYFVPSHLRCTVARGTDFACVLLVDSSSSALHMTKQFCQVSASFNLWLTRCTWKGHFQCHVKCETPLPAYLMPSITPNDMNFFHCVLLFIKLSDKCHMDCMWCS